MTSSNKGEADRCGMAMVHTGPMMPKIGDRVIYHQPDGEKPYNGHCDHPAIVTAVWARDCVNLKVFFDCGPVEDRTSVCPMGAHGGFML